MPDACAREQPATGQATESVDPALEVLNSEKLEIALVDLFGQLLIGCPDYPAVRIRPRLFPKLRVGHLEALCNAVDTIWQTRNAELPTESRLRPKAIAWLAAAALGDSFLTREQSEEQSEKLGKCIQVELGQLRLKLKKELKSVREHKRFAAKDPEHSEELPWFIKAIDAAYCKKVRGLTEAVYQPYYKLFDAKANPAPQRSPVEAATLGATTASKTAARRRFRHVPQKRFCGG